MIRAAIYARISYDPGGRMVGVDRKREACLRLAASRGWTVVAEYIDNNVSASKYSRKARTQYRRLLDDIEAGRMNPVALWLGDRPHKSADGSTTKRLEGATQLPSGWRTAYSGKCSNWPSS